MKKLNKLAQLAKIERYIAQFQKLSNIHERATTDFLNKFEYCWKDGYETGVGDTKITYKANEEANLLIKQNLNQSISTLDNQNADLALQVQNLKNQLSDHRPPEILSGPKLQYFQGKPQPIFDKQMINMKTRWIVQNWRRGWMWLSNWMFAVIAWVAFYGIPPELLALIPEANRENVIPILSALGVICRFIDQSRKKPLPPVQAVQEDV